MCFYEVQNGRCLCAEVAFVVYLVLSTDGLPNPKEFNISKLYTTWLEFSWISLACMCYLDYLTISMFPIDKSIDTTTDK